MTTQFANASYQEVIDLHTESDTVSVIGIHTPCADTPKRMLSGFFDQFRKYRYNGCSICLVPAARLPADPSQVSYEAGEAPIDPRDMLNPILYHGCHGDDIGNILNQFYNDSTSTNPTSEITIYKSDSIEQNQARNVDDTDYLAQLYYRALTDTTWKKAHPQKGFRKSGLRPLVYGMATDHQLLPVTARTTGGIPPKVRGHTALGGNTIVGYGVIGASNASTGALAIARGPGYLDSNVVDDELVLSQNANYMIPQVFTNKLQGLGWLETTQVIGELTAAASAPIDPSKGDFSEAAADLWSRSYVQYTALPRLFMAMILMPPAYKTEQYYRLIINHNFSFKGFRGVSMLPRLDQSFLMNAPSYNDFEDSNDRSVPDEKYPLPCDESEKTPSTAERWYHEQLTVSNPVRVFLGGDYRRNRSGHVRRCLLKVPQPGSCPSA